MWLHNFQKLSKACQHLHTARLRVATNILSKCSGIDVCKSIHFAPFSYTVKLCVLFVRHVWSDSEISTLTWRYKCLCSLLRRCELLCLPTLSVTVPYFLHKTKMADDCFVDFHHTLLNCSLFSQINPPQDTIWSKCLGSFVAIQQQACDEIANKCFELLFIYTSRDSPPLASFHSYGAPLTTFPRRYFYYDATTITILVYLIMLGQCMLTATIAYIWQWWMQWLYPV